MTNNDHNASTSGLEGHFGSLNLAQNNGGNNSASARFEKFFNTSTTPAGGAEQHLHPHHHPLPQQYQHQHQHQGHYATLGVGAAPAYPGSANFRSKSIGRGGIPSQWTTGAADPSLSPAAANSPLSPHAHLNSPSFYPPGGVAPQPSSGFLHAGYEAGAFGDDDVIPTAIVVKNIPFSVKKEQLLQIIEDLAIPMPYAFNYHYDQGIFRGLAFANFRSPEEADAVVAALNGFDVAGRKLRVEYKKVLQAGEKERIEKEKAIKRMRSMQIEKERIRRETDGGGTMYPGTSAIPPLPQAFGGPALTNANTTSPLPPPPSLGLEPPGGTSSYTAYSLPSPAATAAATSNNSNTNTANTSFSSAYAGTGGGGDSLSPPGSSTTSHHPVAPLTADALSSLGSASGSTGPSAPSERSGFAASKKEELDLNDAQTLEIYSRVLLFKDDRMRDELAFSRNLSPMERRTVHLVAQKLGLYHYSLGESDDRHVIVTKHEVASAGGSRPLRSQASTIGRSHRNTTDSGGSAFLGAATTGRSAGLRTKKSAPDMKRGRVGGGGGGDFDGSSSGSAVPPLPLPSGARAVSSSNELSVPGGGAATAGLLRKSNGNLRSNYSNGGGANTVSGSSTRRTGAGAGAAGLQNLFAPTSPFDAYDTPSSASSPHRTSSPGGAGMMGAGALRQPRGPPGGAGYGTVGGGGGGGGAFPPRSRIAVSSVTSPTKAATAAAPIAKEADAASTGSGSQDDYGHVHASGGGGGQHHGLDAQSHEPLEI